MSLTSIDYLERSIINRSAKRGLHADLARFRYYSSVFYDAIPNQYRKKALYVGVGHGHDALLALLDGRVENIVGVDPYEEEDGNNDEDYNELLSLIDHFSLQDRFTVIKGGVGDFLDTQLDPVTLIVCADVLHHIFLTPKPLNKSLHYQDAVTLFKKFSEASNHEGMLAISDVQRYGLRPFLKNHGVLNGQVDYRTKQAWWGWDSAISQANWSLQAVNNYIPYALRKQAKLWQGTLGHYTLCDRYFIYYTATQQNKENERRS